VRARDGVTGWGWVTRLLHWAMAPLILFQLALGPRAASFTPDLIERFRLAQLHKSWGAVVFALALLRVGWRLANRAPPPPPGMPAWQVRAAWASHRLLYSLMLIVPLSGWVRASASPTQDLLGIDNMVFGWFALPDPWVPGARAVEAAAEATHVWSAALLAFVLAVHVGAALKHRFVDRDGVLARMTFGE
jgi:cytochrome b561